MRRIAGCGAGLEMADIMVAGETLYPGAGVEREALVHPTALLFGGVQVGAAARSGGKTQHSERPAEVAPPLLLSLVLSSSGEIAAPCCVMIGGARGR